MKDMGVFVIVEACSVGASSSHGLLPERNQTDRASACDPKRAKEALKRKSGFG